MASPLTATLTMFSIQVGFPVAGILVADKIFWLALDLKKICFISISTNGDKNEFT